VEKAAALGESADASTLPVLASLETPDEVVLSVDALTEVAMACIARGLAGGTHTSRNPLENPCCVIMSDNFAAFLPGSVSVFSAL
jgi:hypothetical protein